MNHPCLCLIAPISQHIMLPQSTVATALILNWDVSDILDVVVGTALVTTDHFIVNCVLHVEQSVTERNVRCPDAVSAVQSGA